MRNKSKPKTDTEIGTIQDLSFCKITGSFGPKRTTPKFIKGPIPFDWIAKANALPGKAGPVGLGLWFLVGVKRTHIFKLSREIEILAGCKRKAVANAIIQLEKAGLIIVSRQNGARPTVQILNS